MMLFPPTQAAAPSAQAAIAAMLDDFHLAAAQADETRYFAHFDEGAVFLGTDATERWTKTEFEAYAHPYFAKGKAWSFHATRRAITMSPDRKTAWFDEDLATPNLGPCRGSGVILLKDGLWKIAQYNLSVTVPNGVMKDVKALIEARRKP
ncbi:MAG TPA: nuclear transport factor 2 family protein [Holophagaceae bacterium]|nr:nuclear transport factor 2 family protein [Holophagaceae bacterium]